MKQLINKIMEVAYNNTESFELESWKTSRLLYLVAAVSSDGEIDLSNRNCADDAAFLTWLHEIGLIADVKAFIVFPVKSVDKMTCRELLKFANEGGLKIAAGAEIAKRLNDSLDMLEICINNISIPPTDGMYKSDDWQDQGVDTDKMDCCTINQIRQFIGIS